jgi:hypothetical protein
MSRRVMAISMARSSMPRLVMIENPAKPHWNQAFGNLKRLVERFNMMLSFALSMIA